MPVEYWLIFILIVMIIASIAALEMEDILSSIVAIGVVGLGVSLSFLFLQAPDWDDARWVEEIGARMRQAFGPLPQPRLLKRVTEKRATFSCVPNLFRPPCTTPCQGVFLAGDYVAGPYPATLEGAVRSGVQCAQILIAET